MESQNIYRISEEQEDSTEDEKILEVKKKRGRPKIAPELVKNKKEDYYRNYYHENRKEKNFHCPHCNKLISKNNFSAHKKSMKCKLFVLQQEQNKKTI